MSAVANSPLTRKLSAFVALSSKELAVLERLHQRRRSFVAGRDLVHQGQTDQAAYILASGWVCSYKLQPDGTRQIVDFQIAGDFLGLRSVLLRTSDHSFEPIVDIQAVEASAHGHRMPCLFRMAFSGARTVSPDLGRDRKSTRLNSSHRR